jgi:hypothetical protein
MQFMKRKIIKSQKIIYCNYLSRFANNLFQYCYAHILNKNYNGTIKFSSFSTLISGESHDKPIEFEPIELKPIFRVTNSNPIFKTKEQMGKFDKDEKNRISLKYQINPTFNGILSEKDIILSGYFQNYKYYKHNKSFIRSLLYKLYEYKLKVYPSSRDIVIHYRGTDIPSQTPINFFLDCISNESNFLKIVVVTDDPKNSNLQMLYAKLNENYKGSVVIQSKSVIEDFLYIMYSETIIMSVSTFSWMAAWLSDAKKIYFPVDDYIFNRDGDNRLIVDDEPRYHYVDLKDYKLKGRRYKIIKKINELKKILFNKY